MITFITTIQKFEKQGEKTGWTYIEIPEAIATQLLPDNKKSFRVKGKLDNFEINGVALLPMGLGNFILALNNVMRKGVGKRKNDTITVQLIFDKVGYELNYEFIECLQDEPLAHSFFNTLAKGHQNYFSKWIESAKTDTTKSKRIAMAINALAKQWDYVTMIRTQTTESKLLKGY